MVNECAIDDSVHAMHFVAIERQSEYARWPNRIEPHEQEMDGETVDYFSIRLIVIVIVRVVVFAMSFLFFFCRWNFHFESAKHELPTSNSREIMQSLPHFCDFFSLSHQNKLHFARNSMELCASLTARIVSKQVHYEFGMSGTSRARSATHIGLSSKAKWQNQFDMFANFECVQRPTEDGTRLQFSVNLVSVAMPVALIIVIHFTCANRSLTVNGENLAVNVRHSYALQHRETRQIIISKSTTTHFRFDDDVLNPFTSERGTRPHRTHRKYASFWLENSRISRHMATT